MPPKRHPKKQAKTVTPLQPYLPRNKILPRELLPLVGNKPLKDNIELELEEFTKVNEYLPCLSLVLESDSANLVSPIESFEVIGEPDGYFLDIRAQLRDVEEPTNLELFVKRVHLVEPIPTMEGVYVLPDDGSLPQAGDAWKKTLTKIHNPYNEAYIDALCAASLSRLVETGASPHWAKFYGTFNARVEKYLYNITGEYSSLRKTKWFDKNKNKGLFNLVTVGEDPYKKDPIEIFEGDDDDDDEIACDNLDGGKSPSNTTLSSCKSDLPSTDEDTTVEMLTERLVRITKIEDEDEKSSKTFTSESEETGSEQSESGKSESGSETSSSSNSDESSESESSFNDECEFYAEFRDFPVQVTFHERCEDTMDTLLDMEESTDDPILIDSKDERWSAWLFQIISALTVAQYHYGFVHNDLHTNNIMWCGTEEEYLYYKLDAKTFYRVPTYGNLMKIIDFGRASFYLKERTELLITDSFEEGNDAAGQYNCPPYYDPKEKRVDPNPSFDLCRLAVSMFDALYPEHPGVKTPEKIVAEEQGRVSYESVSELYNILWSWLTDEKGKNILRNPNDSERFPDFDLYKHIARYSNNCIPRVEARRPYFEQLYRIEKEKIPEGTKIWEIPLQ